MDKEKVAELINDLEGEVNNGGFDQFFYNSAGDNTREVIQALEEIGAYKTAEIVKKAVARFPGGMPPQDRYARQDILLDQVSPKRHAFRDLDEEFFAYPDDLAALLAHHKAG